MRRWQDAIKRLATLCVVGGSLFRFADANPVETAWTSLLDDTDTGLQAVCLELFTGSEVVQVAAPFRLIPETGIHLHGDGRDFFGVLRVAGGVGCGHRRDNLRFLRFAHVGYVYEEAYRVVFDLLFFLNLHESKR